MSFTDLIKNSALEAFSSPVSLSQITLALAVAFGASLLILLVYRMTSGEAAVNHTFLLTLMMTAMISAMIVTTITSNLALSLGMVGALSIVRFRTAIKNPLDTVYMFWAVAAGITAGAQAYLLCLFACALIGAIVYVYCLLSKKGASVYVLVVRANTAEAIDAVRNAVDEMPEKKRLCSQCDSASGFESVYELAVKGDTAKRVEALGQIEGVTEVSLTQCATTAI